MTAPIHTARGGDALKCCGPDVDRGYLSVQVARPGRKSIRGDPVARAAASAPPRAPGRGRWAAGAIPRTQCMEYRPVRLTHSALILAARITLAHFSKSSSMSF